MKTLRNIAAVACLLVVSAAIAQAPSKVEAHQAYLTAANSKLDADLVKAQGLIDQVAEQEAHLNDPEVWLIRGYVYKDLFKSIDQSEPTAKSRLIALESFYNAHRLDADKKYNAKQAYDYLATTLFNDAARALNDLNDELASALYGDYVTAEKTIDPKKNLRSKEVEFKNALGTLYTRKMRMEKDLQWFHKATETYEDVLQIDPENYGANYNMATLFYNRGIQNIFSITPENTIVELDQVQVVSKEFFIESLPYMLKAHELKPDRKETLIGLEGIYYSLQDHERSLHFKTLLTELLKKEKQGSEQKDE